MVVTFLPATPDRGVTQERRGTPSRCTVQAPHCASPQPKWGLLWPRSLRMAYSRGMFGSPSTETAWPSSVNSTVATEGLSVREVPPKCGPPRAGLKASACSWAGPRSLARERYLRAGIARWPRASRSAPQQRAFRSVPATRALRSVPAGRVLRESRPLRAHDAEALAGRRLHHHPALDSVHDLCTQFLQSRHLC